MALAEQHFGLLHSRTAHAVLFMSGTAEGAGNFAETEKLLLRAQSIYETIYEPGSWHHGYVLLYLAEFYKRRGRFEEAESVFRRALEIRKSALGPDHPYSVEVLTGDFEGDYVVDGLAGLHYLQGRLDEAERLYLQALEPQRRALGENHAGVANVYFGLALVRFAQGNDDEARSYYARAARIWEDTFGQANPIVPYSLANFWALVGDRDRAIELLHRAVALGWSSPSIAHDSYLSSLRGDEEFEAIVAEVKERIGKE